MRKKLSTLPLTQPPTRYPGAQLVWLRGNPTQARQTTQIEEPTYWLISSTKSSPEERNAARRVARRAKTFAVIDGDLYKRSPSKIVILMKCIPIA